ncbi:MAG: ribonuclease D [Pseudomonadales bacterium]|nr:ribonuclease D [Pseudomonadales bacterium]MCP5331557.1 ribonuclease D [Pseudomonadales bacterium]MCP5343440.1 ribonuclease D [Pseudomonadales bacterium]
MMNETVTVKAPVVVTDNSTLQQLCAQWQQRELIALDTEFVRVDTFFPKLGLIQVGDGEHNYLLDPLSLTQWDCFVDLLRNPAVIKVLHSCSEDLLVFKECLAQLPTPLFDTQRAAAFLGYGYSISYQNLVKEMSGTQINKDQTRSDWLQRPLSAEQLDYAALDVAYLPAIARHLQQKLSAAGRAQWAQEEFQQMLDTAAPEASEQSWQEYYQNVGGAWRLRQEQLAALQRLCVWRESETRRRNKPRNWVARDSELLAIANAMPESLAELQALSDLPRPLSTRDGPQIVELVNAKHLGVMPRPELLEQPLNTTMRKTLKRCQEVVRELAEQLGLAPELLARKKQLMPLLLLAGDGSDFAWPVELGAWRQALLEQPLRAALSKGEQS